MLSWLFGMIPFVGKIVDAWAAHDQKKMDVSLEKYKVDGVVNVQLIQQDVEVVKARAALLTAGQQYLGVRMMQYGFVYPLIVWFGLIIGYCIFQPYFPGYIKPVLALPAPLNEWGGWMMMYLFLHSSVKELLHK